VAAHSKAVDAVLGEELSLSLREPLDDSNAAISLQNVRHASPRVAALFIPRIKAWLDETRGVLWGAGLGPVPSWVWVFAVRCGQIEARPGTYQIGIDGNSLPVTANAKLPKTLLLPHSGGGAKYWRRPRRVCSMLPVPAANPLRPGTIHRE